MIDEAPRRLFHFSCYECGAYTRAAPISTTGKTLRAILRELRKWRAYLVRAILKYKHKYVHLELLYEHSYIKTL